MHLYRREWTLWLAGLLILQLISSTAASQEYSEQLTLRTLPFSNLLASFDFHSEASAASFDSQHFRFLPRALSQILQYTHTNELHLRFTSGRWDESAWGTRPRNGTKEGGAGVELWAWVEGDTREQAETRWFSLANTLSGLFCASMNFIDSTRTIRPKDVFPPMGNNHNLSSNLHLLHGQLAREVVCTENLTPYLKLIPCKGKAGISSLFDGHKLFDAAWQSMAIDIWPSCSSMHPHNCTISMDQTVDMILDIDRAKRPRDDPIPRPVDPGALHCNTDKPYNQYGDSCFPEPHQKLPGFSLSEIFGRPMKGSCPLSGNFEDSKDAPATICVENSAGLDLAPITAGPYVENSRGGSDRCFHLPAGSGFDLAFGEQPIPQMPPADATPLKVERSFSGRGQERGGLHTVFINPLSSSNVSFVYLESLPWFMKPYLHTLKAELKQGGGVVSNGRQYLRDLHYVPAIDRLRGSHLELKLSIPPESTLSISYDFDKSILRYTEYPPDPNRGFDIPPGVVRILESPGVNGDFLRTNGLVLYLPTPDFSMPYNVIILTSTVIALGFGSIFNIIVRRLVGVDEAKGLERGGLVGRVRGLLVSLKARFRPSGDKPKVE